MGAYMAKGLCGYVNACVLVPAGISQLHSCSKYHIIGLLSTFIPVVVGCHTR